MLSIASCRHQSLTAVVWCYCFNEGFNRRYSKQSRPNIVLVFQKAKDSSFVFLSKTFKSIIYLSVV